MENYEVLLGKLLSRFREKDNLIARLQEDNKSLKKEICSLRKQLNMPISEDDIVLSDVDVKEKLDTLVQNIVSRNLEEDVCNALEELMCMWSNPVLKSGAESKALYEILRNHRLADENVEIIYNHILKHVEYVARTRRRLKRAEEKTYRLIEVLFATQNLSWEQQNTLICLFKGQFGRRKFSCSYEVACKCEKLVVTHSECKGIKGESIYFYVEPKK